LVFGCGRLHTGELKLRNADVGGIAMHIAARIMGAAAADEILTSGTVRDLVVGSSTVLEDRGTQPLKGFQGTWRLFTLAGL
jgi:class 3 adenylate cyclase